MFQRDRGAQTLGVVLHEARVGFARLSMLVDERMLNGHGIAHGGFVFALADTAFAYACNSRNERTVALQCSVSFTTASREGDVLVATAEERTSASRTSTYDVLITREGKTVALFRGVAYRLRGTVLGA
ncbi:MAG: hydroxyphenylacetyl-CoA thioesterase PaaI [Candidatus Baltobacteraceae bacterium]